MRQAMAGGRRGRGGGAATTGRAQLGSAGQGNNGGNIMDDKKASSEQTSSTNAKLLAPKHIPIPTLPVNGQLWNEGYCLAICLIITATQIMNIYKTVWWLPQSHNDYSMVSSLVNFYLMDPYLIVFIVTMISRQYMYSILRIATKLIVPSDWLSLVQKIMMTMLFIVVMGILIWCISYMVEWKYTVNLFYFVYPILIYLLVFGTSIGPFFDMDAILHNEDKKSKFLTDRLLHNCSQNPSAIRTEVANLMADFKQRIKRALFLSSGNIYMCCIAPMIFVPQQLHYDRQWAVIYILLSWVGLSVTHCTQVFPIKYCDVLHKSALHLGRWNKINTSEKNTCTQPQAWNESVIWPNGSVVKHNKELYRSEGLCTAAEPGHQLHYRFNVLFNNPTIVPSALLTFQISVLLSQLLIAINNDEWYQTVTMMSLSITNYYTFYTLTRDNLICWKIHKAEELLHEKTQLGLNIPATDK